MPRYVIREMQYVLAVREVEADDEDAAIQAFFDGDGKPIGKDGEVTDSMLLSVDEMNENADEPV